MFFFIRRFFNKNAVKKLPENYKLFERVVLTDNVFMVFREINLQIILTYKTINVYNFFRIIPVKMNELSVS